MLRTGLKTKIRYSLSINLPRELPHYFNCLNVMPNAGEVFLLNIFG